jgi:phosphopantothenoylcysteine decarboxylase / phosphopantothenate---cysteine ligase
MMEQAGERLLLGITGGIAAYKSAHLVRQLRARGAVVRVVMTQAAQAFITPLTLQALSGYPVRCTLLDPQAEAGIDHIELARWADRILVAPASAHFMARLAHGLADDLLTTLCLATQAPVVLAPAMNQGMWRNPATQANAALLQGRGIRLLGPVSGEQACGEIGPGRMLEVEAIVAALWPPSLPLQGQKVLMTAGPTREPIDPVRYLSNRSSGRMGYALAQALTALGAEVSLVSGPVALPAPQGVERVMVETALEMAHAVWERVAACQIFVATAAVADYRMESPQPDKIKKGDEVFTLQLTPNPDILAGVAARPQPPFTVGFAAETQNVEAYALDKLQRKGIDLIAANQVGGEVGGFESEDNALVVLWRGGRVVLPLQSKTQLAHSLAALIADRYHALYKPIK